MLILSRFFLFSYFHGHKKPYKDTFFLHFIAKKLWIYLVETNIYCTFATANKEQHNLIGVLVQLVRIHACHAWGHEFEPRTHRHCFLFHLVC